MGSRQRVERVRANAIVLDEDQVPEFDKPVAVQRRYGHRLSFPRTQIVVNLGAGAAGAGVGHFPEVILAAHVEEMGWIEAGLLEPVGGGFLVNGNLALFVPEDGCVQALFGQTPNIGQQLPGPGDGLFLVIVAERPVAEHFEKGMMAVIAAHVLEVVVLTGHAHTFLRIHGARIGTLVRAEENVLELHHAGVGKKQGGIPARDERGGRHEGMSMFDEEVNVSLANLCTGRFGKHDNSRYRRIVFKLGNYTQETRKLVRFRQEVYYLKG